MKKFNKFICWLIGHNTIVDDKWYPSIDAPIVIKWEQEIKCLRCGFEKTSTYVFEEEKNEN